MQAQLRSDVHPPLYYWFLRLWLEVIPATGPGLRSFSGVCLIVATAILWRFLRRVAGPDTGFAALALWLANPLVILMAGYGRMYLLLAVWCIVVIDAAWRVCVSPSVRAAQAILTAATVAGLLTHNWFAFFLCGLGTMMAMQFGTNARRLAPPLAAGALLYALLWGGAAWSQVSGSQEQLAWLQPPGWQAPFEAAVAHLWLPLLASPLILVLAAIRKHRAGEAPLVQRAALLAAVVTIAIPLAVSLWKPVFNPRFTIIAAPFLALALAGLVQRGGAPAASLLLLMGAGWGVWDSTHPSPCNSRAAAGVLSQQARGADTVIFTRLTRKPVEWYWRDESISRLSFPAAIDRHPGYEGTLDEAALRQEAAQLANGITGRIFVLADPGRPAPRILLEALRASRQEHPPCLACEQAGQHYFSRMILFEARR
ncbi:MAG TPA: glycosyltransferase family 39 protein [Paludibaculum sp.]